MSLKGKKSNKNKTAKKKSTNTFNFAHVLKKALVVFCFLGVIAVPVYAYMQNSKAEHDLSVVGNGLPTVVQVHDPGCRLCNQLKSNLGKVKGEFEGKIQFKTANILKQKGRDFAKKYKVPHVTLLFFDKKGERVNTIQGVTSSDVIKTNLQSLSNRR